jgi:hypothetical protein
MSAPPGARKAGLLIEGAGRIRQDCGVVMSSWTVEVKRFLRSAPGVEVYRRLTRSRAFDSNARLHGEGCVTHSVIPASTGQKRARSAGCGVMKMWSMVAAAAVLFASCNAASAQSTRARMSVGMIVLPSAVRHSLPPAPAVNRLPFRAGLYGRDRQACSGPGGELIGIAPERVIVGGQSCSVDSVRSQGRTLKFREICWRDGREVAIERRWSRESVSRFGMDGSTYERCRETVTAIR